MIPVKSLNQTQMKYIMGHHKEMTAQQMASILQVEDVNVMIFCQVNGISPLPRKYKGREVRNHRDTFHVIPENKKQRMKRIGYNAQKKTA